MGMKQRQLKSMESGPDPSGVRGARSRRSSRRLALVGLLAANALMVGALGPAWAMNGEKAFARAYGLKLGEADVLGLIEAEVAPSPEVMIRTRHGKEQAFDNLAVLDVLGLIQVKALKVAAEGRAEDDPFAAASAEVLRVTIGGGLGETLVVDVLRTDCRVEPDEDLITGDTTVARIKLPDGTELVNATLPRNVKVKVAGVGKVFLNEQVVEKSPGRHKITVNGIRIELDVLGLIEIEELVINHVECKVRI